MKSKDLSYPAILTAERKGGFSVSFPNFPEAHTQGDTREEALSQAVDCLHTAIEWRLEDRLVIPPPSRVRRGQVQIPVALDLAPKVALLLLMREQKMTNVKLAQKLKVNEVVVRRMLNPKHRKQTRTV